MMKYNFEGINPQVEQSYDNTAAHTELKAMMNRNERLTLYFTIDRYGYEAAYSGGYPFSISGDIRSVPS